MPDKTDRVWIELEHPGSGVNQASLGERRAAMANRMLARLRENDDGKNDLARFWWNASKSCYCYGDSGGYKELSDNGFWFNLSYFGRED